MNHLRNLWDRLTERTQAAVLLTTLAAALLACGFLPPV